MRDKARTHVGAGAAMAAVVRKLVSPDFDGPSVERVRLLVWCFAHESWWTTALPCRSAMIALSGAEPPEPPGYDAFRRLAPAALLPPEVFNVPKRHPHSRPGRIGEDSRNTGFHWILCAPEMLLWSLFPHDLRSPARPRDAVALASPA